MKQTRPSVRRPAENRAVDSSELSAVLGALEDSDCRQLVQATVDDALSATELSEECDLPLSTTYRKVEKLTDAGLLAEQIRVCSSGKHTNEYTCTVDSIHLSVESEGIDAKISEHSMQESEEGHKPGIAGAD